MITKKQLNGLISVPTKYDGIVRLIIEAYNKITIDYINGLSDDISESEERIIKYLIDCLCDGQYDLVIDTDFWSPTMINIYNGRMND